MRSSHLIKLQDYYQIRIQKYRERKILIIKEIEDTIQNLGERARFILAVINGELIVHNRPEAEIYDNMTRMGFVHKLLDLVKTREFTKERVEKLHSDIEVKRQEKLRLEDTRPEQIWYDDLEEFIVEYCQREGYSRSTFESCNKPILIEIDSTIDETN